MMGGMPEVEDIPAAATHDLRLRVLRGHLADPDVSYPADHLPGSFHLGVRERGRVVAIASFSVEAAPGRPDVRAARLRGMAVDPAHERRGLGRALVDAARQRLSAAGFDVLWANARTSALDFYRAQSFEVEGEEFTSLDLPHQVVVLHLRG
jgi:ribosomal protein S18 acetylase RimI-like enzyme